MKMVRHHYVVMQEEFLLAAITRENFNEEFSKELILKQQFAVECLGCDEICAGQGLTSGAEAQKKKRGASMWA